MSGRVISVALFIVLAALAPRAAAFEFHQNDRVIFLGNTYAERLRHHSYLETALLLHYPQLHLTFRNLGWSADEVVLRPRPLNFGDIHQHLTEQKADVIFLFYGSNESFAGEHGVEKFTQDYQQLITDILAHQYNGRSAPRLVLVSPIPQERLDRQPAMAKRNEEIGLYADAIKTLASANEIGYVDLFGGFAELMQAYPAGVLTFNGVHLTALGDWFGAFGILSELDIQPSGALGVSLDVQRRSGEATIGTVEIITASDTSASFRLGGPVPGDIPFPLRDWPPPVGLGTTLVDLITVKQLKPGRYELRMNGDVLLAATREALAGGAVVFPGFFGREIEAIRQRVVHKNRLFFDRWRAVNGYYIYGDRKEPFGVVSFPPEMQRFDEIIAQEEAEIHRLCSQKWERTFELVRVGDE